MHGALLCDFPLHVVTWLSHFLYTALMHTDASAKRVYQFE